MDNTQSKYVVVSRLIDYAPHRMSEWHSYGRFVYCDEGNPRHKHFTYDDLFPCLKKMPPPYTIAEYIPPDKRPYAIEEFVEKPFRCVDEMMYKWSAERA